MTRAGARCCFPIKGTELLLLLQEVEPSWLCGLFLQGQVYALVAVVLLGLVWLDPPDIHPQAKPPGRETAQAKQRRVDEKRTPLYIRSSLGLTVLSKCFRTMRPYTLNATRPTYLPQSRNLVDWHFTVTNPTNPCIQLAAVMAAV